MDHAEVSTTLIRVQKYVSGVYQRPIWHKLKSKVTIQHFPEIDKSGIFYALLPDGYIGCSVTIELTYAYAKRKKVDKIKKRVVNI